MAERGGRERTVVRATRGDARLFNTDSFQATIWRVPPGGGTPKIWFQSPVLDTSFGANGMRFDPKGNLVYFSVTFDPMGAGYIYTLPRVANPNPSAITFDDKSRSLLVANHAIFFPTPEQFFAIFDVLVDDKADHLNEPHIP